MTATQIAIAIVALPCFFKPWLHHHHNRSFSKSAVHVAVHKIFES
jgi:hypothetical protein